MACVSPYSPLSQEKFEQHFVCYLFVKSDTGQLTALTRHSKTQVHTLNNTQKK